TAVVLGEPGRGVDLEDVRQLLTERQLALEDSELVRVAAITGNRVERHALPLGGLLHPRPAACGLLREPERATVTIETGECQARRFGGQHQSGALRVFGGVDVQLIQPATQS